MGWGSRAEDFGRLTSFAEPTVRRMMTERLRKRMVWLGVRLVSIGIDIYEVADSEHPLAELVAVYDLATRSVLRWTGKSYPTPDQEHRLYHVRDLRSHLLEHNGYRLLLLGCHDLNMFSPRSAANLSPGSQRHKRCADMRRIVKQFKPHTILHHPHATDSPNIWMQGWVGIQRGHSPRQWASGIAFYNGRIGAPRGKLDSVLSTTRSSESDVRDAVVNGRQT